MSPEMKFDSFISIRNILNSGQSIEYLQRSWISDLLFKQFFQIKMNYLKRRYNPWDLFISLVNT